MKPAFEFGSPQLGAAVVNFNGARYLEQTLGALDRAGPIVGDILLVDNGSSDGSADLARRLLPRIRVHALGENRGPAFARNIALRESTARRLLLVDNDVAVLPGCAEALDAALDAHPRAVIAMPAVRYAARPGTVQYAGAQAHFLGSSALLESNVPLASLGNRIHIVSSAISACMLLDRERFGDHSRFDEEFFIYLEDHELGLRARLLGFDVLAVPTAQCLHAEGTLGVSIRETGRFTPTRIRRTIRNRWQVLFKLYQPSTLLRLAPALAVFEVMQFLAAIYKGWLGHWLWATGSQFATLPDLIRRRRLFQQMRVRDDLDVLIGGPFPMNDAMPLGRLERMARRAFDAFARFNWWLAGSREMRW